MLNANEISNKLKSIKPYYKPNFPLMITTEFTPKEMNLLLGLIGVFNEENNGPRRFSFNNIKLLAGLDMKRPPKQTKEFIENFFSPEKNKLRSHDGVLSSIFNVLTINTDEKFIDIELSREKLTQDTLCCSALNDTSTIDFVAFHSLKQTTEKILYLILNTHRNKPYCVLSVKELREALESKTTSSYTSNEFYSIVIRRGVNKINKLSSNLNIKSSQLKSSSRETDSVRFEFSRELNTDDNSESLSQDTDFSISIEIIVKIEN